MDSLVLARGDVEQGHGLATGQGREKMGEQRVEVGKIRVGYVLGLDWQRFIKTKEVSCNNNCIRSDQVQVLIKHCLRKHEQGYWNLPIKSARVSWPVVLKLCRTVFASSPLVDSHTTGVTCRHAIWPWQQDGHCPGSPGSAGRNRWLGCTRGESAPSSPPHCSLALVSRTAQSVPSAYVSCAYL